MGEEPELTGALRGFRRRRFHGTLYAGDRRTTVKDRKKEIGKGLLNKMLADLGIDREEFRGTE